MMARNKPIGTSTVMYCRADSPIHVHRRVFGQIALRDIAQNAGELIGQQDEQQDKRDTKPGRRNFAEIYSGREFESSLPGICVAAARGNQLDYRFYFVRDIFFVAAHEILYNNKQSIPSGR